MQAGNITHAKSHHHVGNALAKSHHPIGNALGGGGCFCAAAFVGPGRIRVRRSGWIPQPRWTPSPASAVDHRSPGAGASRRLAWSGGAWHWRRRRLRGARLCTRDSKTGLCPRTWTPRKPMTTRAKTAAHVAVAVRPGIDRRQATVGSGPPRPRPQEDGARTEGGCVLAVQLSIASPAVAFLGPGRAQQNRGGSSRHEAGSRHPPVWADGAPRMEAAHVLCVPRPDVSNDLTPWGKGPVLEAACWHRSMPLPPSRQRRRA